MKRIGILTAILVFLIPALACNNLMPGASPTDLSKVKESSASPSLTVSPKAAKTAAPKDTAKPNEEPTQAPQDGESEPTWILVPTGEPAASWKDIPIMPGATSGQEGIDYYVYAIKETSQDVHDFYEKEMTGQGWEIISDTNDESGFNTCFNKESMYVCAWATNFGESVISVYIYLP